MSKHTKPAVAWPSTNGHLRMQRRIRLTRYCVICMSKTGASLSIGGRWLKLNLGRRGIRLTLSWPSTGLSYYWLWRWPGQPKKRGE